MAAQQPPAEEPDMGERIRIRFSKTGKAKYISHLDLMATLRRALLRSGVRLGYSEGFNPHPYISAALPLQVGCGSICELIDFETADGAAGFITSLPDRMNESLPEGIEVLEAYNAGRKFKDITWLEVYGELYYGSSAPEDIETELEAVFTSQSIVISKKTKRGLADVDIAPFVHDVKTGDNGSKDDCGSIVCISAIISAQNPTITPGDLLSAISAKDSSIAPRYALFTRTQVYDIEMSAFR